MNVPKKFFDSFCEPLFDKPIKVKMKMKLKKIGKMSLIFEISMSKLGYMDIFMKIWKSPFTISLFNFDYLSDEDGEKFNAKNEDEDEKIWKNKFHFWIFYIKIRFYGNFHENLRRKDLTLFLGQFWLIEVKIKTKMK